MNSGKKSWGIFTDAFKKIRIIGIIGMILYIVGCFACLVGVNIKDATMPGLYAAGSFRFGYVKSSVTFLPIPVVFIPIMMITAFDFVNKQPGSDFYFSMPVKRVRMYAEIMTAVLSQALLMMVAALITISLCSPFLKYVSVSWQGVLMGTVQTLASCFFVMGVFAIGISLTGNIASNIVSSLLVLAIPRAVIGAFAFFVTRCITFASVSDVWELLEGTNTIMYTFEQITGDASGFIGMSGLIFTFAEGLLYMLAGGLSFRKRKSETAGKNSISPGAHTVFGMAVPYILGLVGDGWLLYLTISTDDDRDEIIFLAVLMYVIAVLLYLIFELICTRKLRSVLKSSLKIPILAALVAASFGAMFFFTDRGNKYVPEEEKTDYITIENTLGTIKGPVTIYDREAFKIITDAYIRQNNASFEEMCNAGNYVYVKIGDGWTGHRRYVFLTDSEKIKLMRAELESDEECAYDYLPPEEADIFSMDYDMEQAGISAKEYYEMAYNELLDNGKKNQSILDFSAGNGLVQIGAGNTPIQTDMYYNDYFYPVFNSENGRSGIISISRSTPKTLARLMDELSEANQGITFSIAANKPGRQSFSLHLSLVDADDDMYDEGKSLYTDEMKDSEIKTLGEILDRYDLCGNPEADNTLFVRFEGFIGVYNLSEDDMKEIKRFIDEYRYY